MTASLENAARALLAEQQGPIEDGPGAHAYPDFEDLDKTTQRYLRRQARAVIESLAKPSGEISLAGAIKIGSNEFKHIVSDPSGYGTYGGADMVWQAMLAKLLEEGE